MNLNNQYEKIDPVIDAKVYLSYNRHEQAVQILKSELEVNPYNEDAKNLLLSIEKEHGLVATIFENDDTQIAFDKDAQYKYYLSYNVSPQNDRKRSYIVLNYPINTEKGIQDLEKQMERIINTKLQSWNISSYIEIKS